MEMSKIAIAVIGLAVGAGASVGFSLLDGPRHPQMRGTRAQESLAPSSPDRQAALA